MTIVAWDRFHLPRKLVPIDQNCRADERHIKSLTKYTVDQWESKHVVYFLLHQNKVVYIGQSCRPILRIAEHFYSNYCGKQFDTYAVVPAPEPDVYDLELALIRLFRPILNCHHGAFSTSLFTDRDKSVIKKYMPSLHKEYTRSVV